MMTLNDAIAHAEEVAEENEQKADNLKNYDGYTELECLECAKEHRQLADWLKELKWWQSQCNKCCETCKHQNQYLFKEPCLCCIKRNKWECGYEGGDK